MASLSNKVENNLLRRSLVFLGSIIYRHRCILLTAHWKQAKPALTYGTAITQNILSLGYTHAAVMYTQSSGTHSQTTCHNPPNYGTYL